MIHFYSHAFPAPWQYHRQDTCVWNYLKTFFDTTCILHLITFNYIKMVPICFALPILKCSHAMLTSRNVLHQWYLARLLFWFLLFLKFYNFYILISTTAWFKQRLLLGNVGDRMQTMVSIIEVRWLASPSTTLICTSSASMSTLIYN